MSERTCPGLTSAHDARDPQLMVLLIDGHAVRDAVLCKGCLSRLDEMGMDWRPERRNLATRPAALHLRLGHRTQRVGERAA